MIKADEIAALNYLPPDHPPPVTFEWINRGTDQVLRRTTIDMLLRTLGAEAPSPSVSRLRQSSGLRFVFRSEDERDRFAAAFAEACVQEGIKKNTVLTAIFDSRDAAERLVGDLIAAGVPDDAISLLWRTGRYVDVAGLGQEGHGKLSIAAAVAGGGIAGAVLGVAVIAIPGLGAVAAAGALAASAYSSVAAVSAAIGATGGAIARMLSDLDVDGNDAGYLARQIQLGKVFVAIDLRIASGQGGLVRGIIARRTRAKA